MILLLKWSSISLTQNFRKSSISITVTSDPDFPPPPPLEFFLIINSYIILHGNIINYGLLSGHPEHKNPWYWKVRRFGGCTAVLERVLLTCYLRSRFKTGTIDLISDCFYFKRDMNADLWMEIWEHKQETSTIQDFYIAINARITPFAFRKRFFLWLQHMVFWTQTTQFLNNNYVCVPKY